MSLLPPDELMDRMAKIKLLSLDTDGVLTDGGLYYTDSGDELRKFDVKDGMGMRRLQDAGIGIVIITASSSPAIAHRANRLGVENVFLETNDKLGTLIAGWWRWQNPSNSQGGRTCYQHPDQEAKHRWHSG